jgi:hypothetical protein
LAKIGVSDKKNFLLLFYADKAVLPLTSTRNFTPDCFDTICNLFWNKKAHAIAPFTLSGSSASCYYSNLSTCWDWDIIFKVQTYSPQLCEAFHGLQNTAVHKARIFNFKLCDAREMRG